ncbi:tyrosine-type recombinase/integrase [Herbaspirillum chlorophenolicum]|uniref:Tyrosine-type recombinase/integrase n=1 Tax=Herbaspirillum chlorophenolicum TaxID=211589 RepID=A0ABW8F0F7_9BURK
MPIMAVMRIIPCRLSNGRRIPVLFRDTPPQPVLLPFLYVALKRQYKAYNTIRNDLVTIKAFYDFFALDGIDVDEALIDGQFAILLTRVEQFLAWLTTEKIAHNVVGRLGGLEPISHYGIDPITRDGYLRSLKSYLLWCVDRYSRSTSANEIGTLLSASSKAIASRFDSFLVATSRRNFSFKSFTDAEIAAIREFAYPGDPKNPFRHSNQFRNWLIVDVLFETGIRVGELLGLSTNSIHRGDRTCYLSVVRNPNAGMDTRSRAPSLKNQHSQRTIAISAQLFERIQHYILHQRRPIRNGRPLKLKHGYLWVSERGNPLAANSLANLFECLANGIRSRAPDLLRSASPHSFRHTFAERFLQYLLEVKGCDMERAKDELRAICGWSNDSTMPQYYSRRYIHSLANLHNQNRIESAWERLKSAPGKI